MLGRLDLKHSLFYFAVAGYSACSGGPPTEYVGHLDSDLAAAQSPMAYQQANLLPMSAQKRVAWRVPAGMADPVFEAEIRVPPRKPFAFLLVEAIGTAPVALVDLNGNQMIEPHERLRFEPSSHPDFNLQARFRIPLDDEVFDSFPIELRFLKHSVKREGQVYSARAISWNTFAGIQGSFTFDETPHLFTLEGFLPNRLQLDPRQAILGIDSNSDGHIDFSRLSPEWAIARNETIVMRAGNQYFSFGSLDTAAQRIGLQAHSRSDYTRIELDRGSQIPPFSFLDFDGQRRNLTEFRGKFVLLDFWGSWCGPCIAEFPNLVEAYAEFHTKGFEIVGMNADPAPQELRRGVSSRDLEEGLEKAQKIVARFNAEWPQAQTGSIHELVLHRFRISAYPTAILLDPEGRIVSRNEADRPLRGPGLVQTLRALMR